MNENAKQPTQEEIKQFWDDVAEDERRGGMGYSKEFIDNHWFNFKCKPTYNFQSVEFEFYGRVEDIPHMVEVYQAVLNELMRIAPEQPTKTVAPAAELATAKQREILDKFHLKYKSNITKQEAQELIKQSIEAVSK